jgi:hypothetical protein
MLSVVGISVSIGNGKNKCVFETAFSERHSWRSLKMRSWYYR